MLRLRKNTVEPGVSPSQSLSIKRVSRDEPLPLSFAQQRLWFLERLNFSGPAYNILIGLRLMGSLNVGALEQSLKEIVRRHEVLRTNFVLVNGSPMQFVSEERFLEISVDDFTGLPEAEREAEVLRVATTESQRSFDFSQDLLMRARLLRLTNREHVFLLTMHHIVSDDWSGGVLFSELGTLYEAFSSGKPSPLTDLTIQYADFAAYQREWLSPEVLEKQLLYWREQLNGAPALLEVPADRVRPPVQTFRGAHKSVRLSKNLIERLNELSRRERVTLYMTLLAAFQTLLSRYTGQDDIVVGTPIANRNHTGIEGLIGFFVNTLVLRTDLSGNPSFRELLQRVKAVALGAYSHQDMPFEKLVEEMHPDRSLSHSPLFQTMFILQNAHESTPQLGGLEVRWLEIENGTAKFDLTLSAVETPEGLSCSLEYSTDLFDEATITRMLLHFQILLEGIVADPGKHLSELPLLSEAECHQLLTEWNNTQREYPRDQTIHQLFEAQVARAPEAVAVVFDDEQLTYRELNCRANQLAHNLRRKGVRAEVRVGIMVERSIDMVVGLLGILKAGGAYVPFDPAYPSERLSFMVEDAQVSVLLTQERLVERVPPDVTEVVCLESGWQEIVQESGKNPESSVTAENAAYVIYTSGSTGKPKGVLGVHRASLNRFSWMWQSFPFAANDVCCQKTSLSFVDSIWEIFGPLLKGIQLVIIKDEELKDPHRLVQALADRQVTRIVMVPSLLRVILDVFPDLQNRVPHLKLWAVSGEALALELSERFRASMPESALINLYGSSEVAADATYYDTRQGESLLSVPIGRPIANTQIYILDRYLNPAPIGIPGEIYIGGDGLARGYLNRPDLTRESFIDSPFGTEPGAVLYKTGDLGRYFENGNIEFLGRRDHQIKLRGYRIELGEIEGVLSDHPEVRECVVVVREDKLGDERLIAYVVAEEGTIIDELRRFLDERLPEYMIPSTFVLLDRLPLSSNNKLDRSALPEPDHGRQQTSKAFVAPRDELEIQLARLWEEALGVRPVGVRDNFFEIGGHSLLAVSLFAEIEKTFNKRIPLAALFQGPTIENLANLLRADISSSSWSSLVPIKPDGSKAPLYLVHPWGGNVLCYRTLAHLLGPDQPVYGLQPQGLDGKQPPLRQIEDMAAHYLKEISSLQPAGPYYIGGLSSGGTIAFEMAQQLQQRGQNVALLVLFDTFVNPGPQSIRNPVRRLPNSIRTVSIKGRCFMWVTFFQEGIIHK